MSKRRNRVTVLCFYADGTRSKYHFNSKPNCERVQDEAKRDGVMVALVFDRKFPQGFVEVSRQTWRWRSIDYIGDTIRGLRFIFGAGEVKTEPEAEIPASNHYNREPCNLPTRWAAGRACAYSTFQYTGEFRKPKAGEYYVGVDIPGISRAAVDFKQLCDERWILRPVPAEANPADEPTTAHPKGEPCTLPVNIVFAKWARGFRFEYAGECGEYGGKWYVNRTGTQIVYGDKGDTGHERELLIAVPDVAKVQGDCPLPVHPTYKVRAKGLRFYETVNHGNPKGKWYVSKGGNTILFGDKPTKRPISRRLLNVAQVSQ
jgi:hypothetical protein